MNNYWKTREAREARRLYDTADVYLEQLLRKEYLRVYKEINSLLQSLVLSMGNNPTANELYTADKFYKLLNEIQVKLTELGNFEKDKMTETFKEVYSGMYKGIDNSFTLPIDTNKMMHAINNVWAGDGMNFSDRIWKNKKMLIDYLQKGMVDSVATGSNWGELSKSIKKAFNTSFSNARRLVRTELTHIQTQSSLDKYAAEGVTQVRFISEPTCCSECQKNNNKVFPIADAPLPPRHCNCRCCLIPVVEI